jgi:hypothetical protein
MRGQNEASWSASEDHGIATFASFVLVLALKKRVLFSFRLTAATVTAQNSTDAKSLLLMTS